MSEERRKEILVKATAISPAIEQQKPMFLSSKGGFGFYTVAIWNLKSMQKFLNSDVGANLSRWERSSIYANMIFNLYVYLEGIMNDGLRMVHHVPPQNPILRKHIAEITRRNVHPFEILKWIDIEFSTSTLVNIKQDYQEPLRFHEDLRNLVAHGGTIHTEGLHEFGASGTFNVVEPDAELRRLVEFLRKKNVYEETAEGPGYITSLGTEKIYEYFKLNCRNFVSDLVSGRDSNFSKMILQTFDYKYFDLSHPGPSSIP